MRPATRALLTLGAAVLGALTLAVPAYADPGPGQAQGCTAGGRCATVSVDQVSYTGPTGDVPLLQYAVAVDGPASSLTFTTHQPADAPVEPASVLVDGVAPPAGAVTVTGPDVTVDLMAGGTAGASVSFEVDASAVPQGIEQTAWAEVVVGDPGAPADTATATSDTARFTVGLLPDLSVSTISSGVVIPRGGTVDVLTFVGGTPVETEATFTVTTPAGVSLVPGSVIDQVTDVALTCTATGTGRTSCTGLRADSAVALRLAASPSLPVRSAVPVTIGALPVSGTDADPSDNTTTIPLRVAGSADLSVSLSPDSTREAPAGVPVGTARTFVVTVTNAGPDPATDVVADVSFLTPDGIAQRQDPFSGAGFTVTGLGPRSLGTLAVGQSASFPVLIEGTTLDATATLGVNTRSSSSDPVAQCEFVACGYAVSSPVLVVAPAAQGAAGPQLAATGVEVAPATTTALTAVALGTVCCLAGRPRRRRAHARR